MTTTPRCTGAQAIAMNLHAGVSIAIRVLPKGLADWQLAPSAEFAAVAAG